MRDRAALGLCPRCALRSALSLGGTTDGFDISGERPQLAYGDYELIEEIGRGGMGVVFRARQRSLDRIVAIKVLCGGVFADSTGRKRLLSEAAAAARLRHPNIVAVHEAGEMEGHAFYSMDLITGQTLDEVSRGGPVSPKRAASWLRKIAAAVHYAHTQHVVHRDLKPSNVLLDEVDEPRITDFGLAKVLDATSTATLTGSIFGSPAYMPPEQAAGRNDEIGPAGDIYSLGAMFYELLTGRPPFQGTSPQAVIEQVKTLEPVALRRLNASVPADLENITLKCLEKKPSQRYATAQELVDELERFLDGQPVKARPVSGPEKVWRWARRRPTLAVLTGASLALALTVVIIVAVSSHQVRVSRDEARTRLAESLLSEAHALRLAGDSGWRDMSLQHLEDAHRLDYQGLFTRALRTEAIAALARSDLARHIVTNLPLQNNLMNVCFDPLFQRVAIWNSGTHVVEIRRVVDGEILTTCVAPQPDEIHTFSADGKFLLLRHGGEMSVWDAEKGALILPGIGSKSYRRFDGGEFSPDGKQFGRGETNGQFVIYDLTKTPPVCVRQWPLLDGLPCETVAWSADEKSLALILGDRTLVVCDASSGRVRWRRDYVEMIWNVTWDNERNWIVMQSGDDRVLMLRPEDGSEIDHLNLTASGTPIARLSSDGRFLAASGQRFGTQIFDATTRRKLAIDSSPAWHLSFDASGMRLGSLLDQGRPLWLEWKPSRVQRTWRSLAQLDINDSLAFSRDGRWLASLTGGGPIIRDVNNGMIVARVALEKTRALAFDAQGQLLCLTDSSLFTAQIPDGKSQYMPALHPILEAGNLKGLDQTRDGRMAVGDMANSLVYLMGRNGQKKIHLPIHPLCVAISANGRWLATGAYQDEDIYLTDVEHPENPSVKLPEAGNHGLFSPDGKKLFTFGRKVRVWKVGDWQPLPDLPVESNDAESILAAISPDGRWMALTQHDREIHLIELTTGTVAAVLDGPGEGGVLSLAFSPDDQTLVIARDRGDLQLWSLPKLHTELGKLGLDW